jgi:hypothetical protein
MKQDEAWNLLTAFSGYIQDDKRERIGNIKLGFRCFEWVASQTDGII